MAAEWAERRLRLGDQAFKPTPRGHGPKYPDQRRLVGGRVLAGGLAHRCRVAFEVEEIVGDFTLEGAPEGAVQRVVDRWGGVDILVNNAGYGGIEPFLDASFKLWTRTLALNVTALAMACTAAGRRRPPGRYGCGGCWWPSRSTCCTCTSP